MKWQAVQYYWENGFSGKISLKKLTQVRQSFHQIDQFDQDPILIAGCGRSGTTLMLSILDAHPHICGLNFESGLFSQNRFSRNVNRNHRNNLKALSLLLSMQEIPETTRRWCEKTPKNIRLLDQTMSLFENNVKVIVMCRDGRDTVTSIHPAHEGYFISPDEWIADTRRSMSFRNNENVFLMRYEDLVQDFEASVRMVLKFLDLPYHQNLKEFDKTTGIKNNVAYRNGVHPISNSSIGKWQKLEHREIVKKLMEKPEAVKLLERLSYL